MAKSLFASLPRKIIQKAVLFHPQKDDFVIEGGNKFHRLGDIQGPIHEFQNAFIIHKNHNINIGLHPFRKTMWICGIRTSPRSLLIDTL